MSLSTMIGEMRGCVSNYSAGLARIHLKNAWTDIRQLKGWSFQLGNTGYTVPGLINAGAVTTVLGDTHVVGDATASAAWLAGSNATSLITQRQFRTGQGTIYNIIAMDVTNPAAVVLTLDRPWIDAYYLGPAQGYSLYVCYIVAPAQSFQAWEYFMDVRNVIHLDVNNTRGLWELINESDPQRQIFSNPGNLIPHGVDNRAGSATPGWAVFELYPQPQSIYVYQAGYSWAGPELTDDPALNAVPYPMTEHVVKTLARVKAYEYAEANKTADNPRGAGADYRFLMQAAKAEYDAQIHEIRSLDRDIYDAWKYQMQRFTNIGVVATFNPATGTVASRNM